ncbi:hypothetical protein E2C01_040380 [Portunus trituberculatus]|uniref:Uncharacterized protein n=1 Tax=Portunus trituberculatus TaxID=210409 RepID=A0A5B7FMI5_PORTR|nr:hypothetical protein [Portunus trituberculatus]
MLSRGFPDPTFPRVAIFNFGYTHYLWGPSEVYHGVRNAFKNINMMRRGEQIENPLSTVSEINWIFDMDITNP